MWPPSHTMMTAHAQPCFPGRNGSPMHRYSPAVRPAAIAERFSTMHGAWMTHMLMLRPLQLCSVQHVAAASQCRTDSSFARGLQGPTCEAEEDDCQVADEILKVCSHSTSGIRTLGCNVRLHWRVSRGAAAGLAFVAADSSIKLLE